MAVRKRNVILDGNFDSACVEILAQLLHVPEVSLLGVSTAWGKEALSNSAANAVALTAGTACGVYAGCAGPLSRRLYRNPQDKAAVIPAWEPLPSSVQKTHGVQYLLDSCMGQEKITLMMLGPLTNGAMVLRIAPEIVAGIEEIIVAGIGADAAWDNLRQDPEAAEVVLRSGAPVTLLCDGSPVNYLLKPETLSQRWAHGHICLDRGLDAGALILDWGLASNIKLVGLGRGEECGQCVF